jgi:hypothetical protein
VQAQRRGHVSQLGSPAAAKALAPSSNRRLIEPDEVFKALTDQSDYHALTCGPQSNYESDDESFLLSIAFPAVLTPDNMRRGSALLLPTCSRWVSLTAAFINYALTLRLLLRMETTADKV